METNFDGLTLWPDDFKDLEERGIIAHAENGWHKLWQPLNILNDDGSIDNDIQGWTVYYDVPEYLTSRETLEMLGFSYRKATEVWNSWVAFPFDHFPADPRTNLVDHAVEYINQYSVEVERAEKSSLEDVVVKWKPLMEEMGMSDDMICMMEGEGDDEQSPLYIKEWIIEIMTWRWRKLQMYREESYRRALSLHCGCHLSCLGYEEGEVCEKKIHTSWSPFT